MRSRKVMASTYGIYGFWDSWPHIGIFICRIMFWLCIEYKCMLPMIAHVCTKPSVFFAQCMANEKTSVFWRLLSHHGCHPIPLAENVLFLKSFSVPAKFHQKPWSRLYIYIYIKNSRIVFFPLPGKKHATSHKKRKTGRLNCLDGDCILLKTTVGSKLARISS